jgi:uncharacterized repeat protein (TIGR01451 family)
MRNQKYLITILFTIVIALFCFASSADAITYTSTGNPDDTDAGTIITAEAADLLLDYTDINGNDKDDVHPPTDIEITVLAVYGFSGVNPVADVTMTVNENVSHYYFVTSEGNASDLLTFTFQVDYSSGNFSGNYWTVKVKNWNDVEIADLSGTTVDQTTSYATTSAEDSEISYYFDVTSSDEAANGDYIEPYIKVTGEASATRVYGQYSGANGLTYAGTSEATDTVRDTIAAPSLVITRTSAVDAPKADQDDPDNHGYGGGTTDVVPGSIWTFTLLITNEGNASAESIVLVDKVPTTEGGPTNLSHINKTGDVDYVALTPADGDLGTSGILWTIWTSNASGQPDKYNDGAWTQVAQIGPGSNTSYPATSITIYYDASYYDSTFIRLTRDFIAAGESATITYGFTIR